VRSGRILYIARTGNRSLTDVKAVHHFLAKFQRDKMPKVTPASRWSLTGCIGIFVPRVKGASVLTAANGFSIQGHYIHLYYISVIKGADVIILINPNYLLGPTILANILLYQQTTVIKALSECGSYCICES